MAGEDRLRDLEERYEGYEVYDNAGEKIGKVDDLFVDEADREEYIGVKMGFFGLKSTLIPMELVRVNERDRTMEVSESKDHVKEAPNFDDDDDITPDYEDRVRRYFGLESMEPSTGRGAYGRYAGATASGAVGATPAEGGMGTEDRMGRESYRSREDPGRSEPAMEPAGGATPSGGMADLETGDRGRTGDEGRREGGDRGGLEMGDRAHVGDESYREGYREGFSEGYHEGLQEGGRGEPGDRGDLDPSGMVTGAGPVEEGMTRRDAGEHGREEGFREGGPGDRTTGTGGPAAGESREMPRCSGEDEREEGTLTRVWRRARS